MYVDDELHGSRSGSGAGYEVPWHLQSGGIAGHGVKGPGSSGSSGAGARTGQQEDGEGHHAAATPENESMLN